MTENRAVLFAFTAIALILIGTTMWVLWGLAHMGVP